MTIEQQRIDIKAGVHTFSGYSPHAAQKDMINFVKRMCYKPEHIRIDYGDEVARQAFAACYRELLSYCEVVAVKYHDKGR
ncbi:hypothetical protein EXU30_03360 [Shewanella maritima]|uniref:Zn-dependent metallo-hydrolase RNA specificity domain-containing protein n=1 Tax=Shewanella maritima TaxID=2520507 RepID=A0A411PEK5_9GAMM|nr:MBL fold metallo-hydrolase RNA specificity domain-containing protein [Shewanella maritima]QBF81840.1 hypothetical protein EXU30_03360 [Shewanella maritima]